MHTHTHVFRKIMMGPKKKLLSSKSKKSKKQYDDDNNNNNNIQNTHYSPAKFLYEMRMKNNDEEHINGQNAKILIFHQQSEQSKVLDASLSDSFHVNRTKHHHHRHHRHHHHHRLQHSKLPQNTAFNNMNADALKAMVVQQASRIAELEMENTFLKNLVVDKQQEQQWPSSTSNKSSNDIQPNKEARLSYEQ
jgi:hypothetical protein